MEFGEGVSVAVAQRWNEKEKCVFCGKKHPKQKKDNIQPTGWTRKKIEGVGDEYAGYKFSLYPGHQSPPAAYKAEGHHCVAFSSFIKEAKKNPRDYYAPMNHYLKEKGYDPNGKNNTIDLPGRKEKEDMDPDANFKNFEAAVLAGKPMQLHIGGHKSDLMTASDRLIQRVYNMMSRPNKCEKDKEDWKEILLKKMRKMENKAFDLTASVTPPFVCHRDPLREAEAHVMTKHGIHQIEYPPKQDWGKGG
jgi:hypothetical protein